MKPRKASICTQRLKPLYLECMTMSHRPEKAIFCASFEFLLRLLNHDVYCLSDVLFSSPESFRTEFGMFASGLGKRGLIEIFSYFTFLLQILFCMGGRDNKYSE